jgi:hypothetical protein
MLSPADLDLPTDPFHPQIAAAIEAAIPSDWTARFVDENCCSYWFLGAGLADLSNRKRKLNSQFQ